MADALESNRNNADRLVLCANVDQRRAADDAHLATMNDLCLAIESNDIIAVKSLIADGSVDVNARIVHMRNRPSLLVLAAARGRVDIVACLLDAGVRIDNVNDRGDAASHIAVRKGHADVVELLVARNASVTLRNRDKQTPISIAIDKKNERLVMLFIDAAMAAGTPLDDATICGAATVSTDVIRFLLFKHRINLSAFRSSNGRTPLHEAVWFKRDEGVFKMLVEVAGVDIDARDVHGRTAVHTACSYRNAGTLACLIAAGANLDLADNNCETPLQHSVLDSNNEIVELLLGAGANVRARNRRGRTACHNASEECRIRLPSLMAFGANLDEPDYDGVTPRQLLESPPPTTEEIEAARRRVFAVQLSLVRKRAIDICVGLQSRDLDALCMCEILLHACGPVAPMIAFHRWWQIATKVKHWHNDE